MRPIGVMGATSLGELGALHVVAAGDVRGDDLGRRTELGAAAVARFGRPGR